MLAFSAGVETGLSLAKAARDPTLRECALSGTCLPNRRFEFAVSALLLASSVVASGACGGSSASDPARGLGVAGAGDAGADNAGSEPQKTVIEFVPGGSLPLKLKPKQSRQLTVQATPAGSFRIRFALSDTDAAADAVLDVSEVETDAEGIAHVTLIAPSRPANFDVRASSTSAAQVVYQHVDVRASGMTTLRVDPSYSGKRKITDWTATAQGGVSCGDLAGNPPPDGDQTATAKLDSPLDIPNVPVGVELAVTVRAGHYVGGCVDLPALSEGDGNQVLVYASDRPLNLAATNLSLGLGATDAHPAFDKLLQDSASLAEDALLGESKDDVAALLDGMRDATSPVNREAFNVARTQNGWDGAVTSAFGKSAARRMRDPAQRWLSTGLLALDAPDALLGHLSALGSGAVFTPTKLGQASPANAGMPGSFVGTWSADSSDTLLLGIDLNWEPSRLVTALAVAPALAEFAGATSLERALSLSVDCEQIAQLLLAHGVIPDSAAFASCDENCALNLCNNAVAAAWGKAQLSSGKEIATLSVTASASAEVGDDARAITLDGSWVGELRSGDATAHVSGALSASSATP